MKTVLRGADTPVREMPEASGHSGKAGATFAVMTSSFQVLMAALREIFDESAYQRFLDRSQLESSPSAYAAFRQENEQAKSRKPRCC
jgi:hypothetical protein